MPAVILAGSDRRPAPVPEGAEGMHFVVGYKGADLRLGGQCLAQALIDRVRSSGAFGAVYLAGPRRVFESLVDCPIIDTDGHLGDNIRAAVEEVGRREGNDGRIAFLACDILPQAGELAEAAAEMLRVAPDAGQRGSSEPIPGLAILLVAVGDDLGASRWKPKYPLRPTRGAEPAVFLPGHLGVAYPAMLRMGLFYRLFQVAYEERNRDVDRRRRAMVARIFGMLVRRDLWNLLRLEPPTLTYRVLRHGLGTFVRWRRGDLDLDGLAAGLAAVFVRRRFTRRWGGRCVRVSTSRSAAFAKDIDTREEHAELEARVKART